ncbi:hypothetical protein V6Z12_D05G291000 [Gossypium hirsutum]
MRQGLKQKQEIFRPGTVVRKLFNITPVEPDYGADSDDGDEIDSDSETQETLDRGNGTESTSRRDTEEGPHPDSNGNHF